MIIPYISCNSIYNSSNNINNDIMLTMHLFSRNIKTPMVLPFQWLNITFNMVRSNSSSSSSFDSSSDSDSDTESSKKNKVINKKGAAEDKKLTKTDYLYAADIIRKQKQLEKELKRTAKSLLSKEEDKERSVSNILNTISYIEQYYQLNKRETPKNYSTSDQRQSELSVIRTLRNQQQETKSTENQLRRKPKLEEEPSVIRTLQNRKHEIENTENQFRRKPKLEEEPSVIRTLQNRKHEIENTENQFRRKPKLEEEPSVIRTLRNQQQETKSTENQLRRKPKLEEEPSVIRTLIDQKHEIENMENQLRRKLEEPSLIRTLIDQKPEVKSTENQRRQKLKLEEEPSVIKTLIDQKQEIESTENQLRQKPKLDEEPSVIKTLRNQQQETKSTENQLRRKLKLEEEPSVIRTLRNEQQETESIENQPRRKSKVTKRPFVIKELPNHQAEKQKQELLNDIFVNQFTEPTAVAEFETWNKCEEFELQRLMKQFPKNAFEEMIRWTEEGKLWHFPIDNEQGLEEENDVHFSKHVFLEQHLAEWCPTKGPIRHYMELVCIGLSKNPYMTVNEKTDHIMWYKEYFGNKQDLLKKLGLTE